MSENLPDTNVGNINYISKRDAVEAVEFGITLASAINIETGERTELFQRENDELREAVKRIKDIEPADVAPVRHARWIRTESFVNGTVTRIYKCSRCDGVAGVRADNGFWYKSNFCPNCGAKMDGGENG